MYLDFATGFFMAQQNRRHGSELRMKFLEIAVQLVEFRSTKSKLFEKKLRKQFNL